MKPLLNANALDYVDAAYVAARLEAAGRTLLSLPASGTTPAKARAAWPEIVRAAQDVYASERLRPPVPSARAITDMDEAFTWIALLGPQAIETKRVVWLRLLVSPINGKHLWSWRRLQEALGLHRETLTIRHGRGVDRITTRLNYPRWQGTEASRLP